MQLVFEDQTKLIVLHCNRNQEGKKPSSRSPSPTQTQLAAATQPTLTSSLTTTPSASPLPQQLELQGASSPTTYVFEPVASINELQTYSPATTLVGSVSLPTVNLDAGQSAGFSDLLYPPFDVNSAEFVSSMEDLVNIIFCQQPNLCLGYN